MHKKLIAFFIFLFVLGGYNIQAQPVWKAVTKEFTENITCSPSTVFSVNAEKAHLVIKGWDKNYIQARIIFSASHSNWNISGREINYMRYGVAKEIGLVELRNAFVLPADIDHIQSTLQVKMELMVPSNNKVQVSNKYGYTTIEQLAGMVEAYISFGNLNLIDVRGNIVISSSYGNILGYGVNAVSFRCTDEKSKIQMSLNGGNYTFLSKYGELDLAIQQIHALNIESTRTDITISPSNIDACRYKIVSREGALYLPERFSSRLIKKGKQTSFTTTGVPSMPLLAITASYNSVTIK